MNDHHSHEDACSHLEEEGTQGLADLFVAYRDRLRNAVFMRLEGDLKSRIDPSDVIQETFVEAQQRLEEYLQDREVAPYVWLRFLTLQRLAILRRFHLNAKQRDARRERSMNAPNELLTSSVNLAACIIDSQMTPGHAIQQAEMQGKLEQALEKMDAMDREVLALRHFEQMSNLEAAQALNLSQSAASKRYYSALKKLQEIFFDLFGDTSDLSL